MTSTPVSDATLFFSNVSTKNQNVTGVSSEGESFSQVMTKTSNQNAGVVSKQNSVADTSKDMKNVQEKGNDFEKGNKIQEEPAKEVDKAEKNTDVEETTKVDEKVEEAMDELEEKAEELIGEIAKELGVSVEDVEKVLEELGITPVELFSKENLTQVVVTLSGAEDVTQIVMDEELFTQVNELLGKMEEMLTEVSENADVTVDELMEYVSREEFKGDLQIAKTEVQSETTRTDMVAEEEKNLEDTVKVDNKNSENVVDETENTVKVEISDTTSKTGEHSEHSMAQNQAEHSQQFLTNVTGNNTLQNVALNVDNGMNPYLTYEAREIMQQILDYIKVEVKPDMSSLQMQLNPEELGTLQIEISNKNGMVTAQFTTQDETVKTIIETQLIQLKENLNEQGVKVQAVEVTVASQQFDRNLDKNGRENAATEEQEKASKKQIRRINLNELDMENELEEADDAIRIAADMMARNGNTIDFMA